MIRILSVAVGEDVTAVSDMHPAKIPAASWRVVLVENPKNREFSYLAYIIGHNIFVSNFIS